MFQVLKYKFPDSAAVDPNARQSPDGLNAMTEWAISWLSGKTGFPLITDSGGGGGGGGGGGAKGPTAEEIRDQYDLAQLANNVDDMSRGLVLAEHRDAKGLARKYVDAVVDTKAEKVIDFETFVRADIEKTSRYKSIYANKPESVKAENYIAPYLNAAMSMVRPHDADEIAIGGAQFGASADQFRQRLNRDDAVTGSSTFISGLEGRLEELNGVFKGA
jgi:hypothetical protein